MARCEFVFTNKSSGVSWHNTVCLDLAVQCVIVFILCNERNIYCTY